MTWTDKVSLPDWKSFNTGLTSPSATFMVDMIGMPRPDLTQDCQNPTNPHFVAHIATESVGPYKQTGNKLFLAAEQRAYAALKADHPDLYAMLSTAGGLCCRWIRGHVGVISNHSFGCADDVRVGGILVPLAADWTLQGLLTVYTYMHAQKLFSGMGYKTRKDSMHFEASTELVKEWHAHGLI